MSNRRIAVLIAALVAIAAPVPVSANETALEFESTLAACRASTGRYLGEGPACPASSSSPISAATSDARADNAGRWSTRVAAETLSPAGGDSAASSYIRLSTRVTTVGAGRLRVHLDELAASSVATCPSCVNGLYRPDSGRWLFVDVGYRNELGEYVSESAWCHLSAGRSAPSTRVVPDDACASGNFLVPAATVVSVTVTLHTYALTSMVGASTSSTDSSGRVAAINVT